MEIKDLIKQAYKTAEEHGFYEGYFKSLNKYLVAKGALVSKETEESSEYEKEVCNVYLSSYINLIISELSEATQEIRKGNNENMIKELADVYIRLSSLIGAIGYDEELEEALKEKLEINKKREFKHGKVI